MRESAAYVIFRHLPPQTRHYAMFATQVAASKVTSVAYIAFASVLPPFLKAFSAT